jgi:hypothetical protein
MRDLRAELLKQRTTRSVLGLFVAMLGLIVLAEVLHGFGLPADSLRDPSRQLMVLGLGGMLGSLFAALLGALSVTSEIRHGTLRPTFLVTPRRRRVVGAKVTVSVLLGAGFGLIGSVVATAAGAAALEARGVGVALDGGDHTLLIVGATGAAALWAAIGVGVGAIVRNQVPALVGICAWLLFVEGLLVDATGGLGRIGRYLPGAAGAAMSGQEPSRLLDPIVALLVLGAYAVVTAASGAATTARRDVG